MTDAQPWPVKLPASPFFMLLLRILSFRPSGENYIRATKSWCPLILERRHVGIMNRFSRASRTDENVM